MDVTNTYKFIGLGAMDVTNPFRFIGFWGQARASPAQLVSTPLHKNRCHRLGPDPMVLVRFRLGCNGLKNRFRWFLIIISRWLQLPPV